MLDELKALQGVSVPSMSDFWAWVKKSFTPAYRAEIEAYLAESSDVHEVERRIETLQRRGMI